MRRILTLAACVFALTFVFSCNTKPLTYQSTEIKPYLTAIAKAHHLRDSLGFTPIADTAQITLEGKSDRYDAILHVAQSGSSRDIAFKKNKNNLEWLGEQQTFEGPRYIKTSNGDIKESITISYQTTLYLPMAPHHLNITYNTPDSSRTASNIPQMKNTLPENEARALIKEWAKSY